MFIQIFVDRITSAVVDIKIVKLKEEASSIKQWLLGADFRLSIGHGAKLDLGMILKREEYEIVEVEHK